MGQGMKAAMLEKFAALIKVAFGLVAALIWDGAIRAIFKHFFVTADNVPATLIYAIVVTIIAMLAVIWIARAVKRAKGKSWFVTYIVTNGTY